MYQQTYKNKTVCYLLFVVVKNHTRYWWNDETYKNKTISYYLLFLKITQDLGGIL